MRKTVHLCLSSHDEVMFRSEADLIMGFNCLALAVLETESRLLAEGFMTTHHHCLVQADNYKEVMRRSRYAYARYFNAKYARTGSIGERTYFSLEIDGLYHTLAALDYVIRQGLHHGLSSTPFEYPHCSANAFFRKELGKIYTPKLLSKANRYRYLPKNKSIDADRYRMSENGLLLREDIIDTAYVEEMYVTPRNYLFHMNKISGERDADVQKEDNDTPPVTVDAIEEGVPDFSIKESKVFEQGRVDHNRMTDLELCAVIDNRILPKMFKEGEVFSIYMLPESKRVSIYEALWQECCQHKYSKWSHGYLSGKSVTKAQLGRCLCIL